MIDPVDARFFTALQHILRDTGDAAAEPCREAVEHALRTGDPLDLRTARQRIEALAPGLRDKVMAQVHARMAGDLASIWSLLPTASGRQRPN